MRIYAASGLLAFVTASIHAQGGSGASGQPPANPTQVPQPQGQTSAVRFEANGWPSDPGTATSGGARSRLVRPGAARATPPAPGGAAPTGTPVRAAADASPPPASGMELGSPLHDVFRATRSPGALKNIGGLRARWRLTVHGPEGEAIGVRDYVHTADLTFASRDRVECDGRVFARDDRRVIAGRSGIPTEHLKELAAVELALFGLHARMPWCYGDGRSFAVLDRSAAERGGERLSRLLIERRPPASSEVFGPQRTPRKRDTFELFYEPTTGTPRELVHTLARSGATRRVLLDDWRDFEGVRMPHRRVYVDESLRPRTTMQLLEVRRVRVTDRDFSLL